MASRFQAFASDVRWITSGILEPTLEPGLASENEGEGCLATAGYKLFSFFRGDSERLLGSWGDLPYFFAQPRITFCAAGVP